MATHQDALQVLARNVGVNLGGINIRVTKNGLNGSKVGAVAQHVGRGTVAEAVRERCGMPARFAREETICQARWRVNREPRRLRNRNVDGASLRSKLGRLSLK